MKKTMKISEKKLDRRAQYTKQMIRQCFLELLSRKSFMDITVTELCHMAEINRGTFYLHYKNTTAVLDELLDEFFSDTDYIYRYCNLICNAGESVCGTPLCMKVFHNKNYRIIFTNTSISEYILKKLINKYKYIALKHILEKYPLISPEQAEALFVFHLYGCFAVNLRMHWNDCGTDWQPIKTVIDTFIQNGFNSLGKLNKNDA